MPESEDTRIYLVVPQDEAHVKLELQVQRGHLILKPLVSAQHGLQFGLIETLAKAKTEQEKWAKYTIDLLKVLSNNDSLANEFGNHWINYSRHSTEHQHLDQLIEWMNGRIARLQSIIERLPLFPMAINRETQTPPRAEDHAGKDIFIVHGHDNAAKHEVARFIEQLDLNPIILHELPDKGRTIIEKFEASSNVGFAVILLTPDDIGSPQGDASRSMPRARQNVILELGFFLGKLGRHRVCALMKGNIDVPTDYSGVLYKTLDETEGWKLQLAREIKQSGIAVNIENALK
jgi:predicted nucleotide-binding protein